MTSEDDQQLIHMTLNGQNEAFGQLIRKYQDRLYNGMVHLMRSENEAEDVVQDAFILAMTRLSSFQGKSAFFTWLYRIAYNVAVTRLRRRRSVASIDRMSQRPLELIDEGPRPDSQIQQCEQAWQLNAALEKLSDEHRGILVLREIEGLDYEAIAEILDLPIGTVRSRLHRARSQLKQLLEMTLNPKDV